MPVSRCLRTWTLAWGLAIGLFPALAAWADTASGLYEELSGSRLDELPGLKPLGLGLGGWLSVGATYNNYNPPDHSNATVTFNDRSAEFQLNQFYLYLERVVNKEAKRWDIGGRFDFLWGTDSRFTQAAGHWDSKLISSEEFRFYHMALPQAYLEIATPYMRGATVKIGHFYTLIGQEVVPSPSNFFYSHAYAMQYGEPFTHTGVLFDIPAWGNFNLNLGAVTGPHGTSDNFGKHPGNWNFLGGVNWASEDGGTSVAFSVTSGNTDDPGSPNRTIGSLVASHDFTEKLHYIFQFDHGSQEWAAMNGASAQWYGINQYFIYALTDTVSTGLRAEWFRDQGGFRVTAIPASYYETTLGLNWKPKPWLLLRTEARYDWMDGPVQIFDSGRRGSQLTIGANAAVSF